MYSQLTIGYSYATDKHLKKTNASRFSEKTLDINCEISRKPAQKFFYVHRPELCRDFSQFYVFTEFYEF